MDQLPTILGALILAGILWLVKATTENTTAIKVLASEVEKTIVPELARLRNGSHGIRDLAQQAVSATELLDQRTAQNERDIRMIWDGIERRSGHERRESPA